MPLKNVTAVNNSLTVQTAGDYEINYNILLNTSQASTAAAAVRRNGEILTQTRGSQTLAEDDTANLSFDGRLSASIIVPLSSGDVLDLVLLIVRTLPDNLNAIINNNANATLSIKTGQLMAVRKKSHGIPCRGISCLSIIIVNIRQFLT